MKLREIKLLKRPVMLICVVAICMGTVDALATSFQNLNFESAVIGTPVYSQVLASEALPHWTLNDCFAGKIAYDTIALDTVCISIQDNLSTFKPLAGNYTVLLQDGIGPPNGQDHNLTSAYIAQTGDVPGTAKSLMFETDMTPYLDKLVVSLNGTAIPMHLYSTGDTVHPLNGPIKTYIGDVSAFAGQTDVELRFTKLVQDPLNWPDHGMVDLDKIAFSSIVSPEPSTLALLCIAAFSLSAYRFHRRRRLQ